MRENLKKSKSWKATCLESIGAGNCVFSTLSIPTFRLIGEPGNPQSDKEKSVGSAPRRSGQQIHHLPLLSKFKERALIIQS